MNLLRNILDYLMIKKNSVIFFIFFSLYSLSLADLVKMKVVESRMIGIKVYGKHHVLLPGYLWKSLADKEYVIYYLDNDEVSITDKTTGKVFFIKDRQNFDFFLDDKDSYFVIEKQAFVGHLLFKIGNKTITVINNLSLRDYLYGVVTAEIGDNLGKKDLEAAKAQAVIARTYYLYQKSKYFGDYIIENSSKNQNYLYKRKYSKYVMDAVNSTSDEVLFYKNELVMAVYSADCGGYLASSEEVWSKEIPYLKAKWDGLDFYSENCLHNKKHFYKLKFSVNELENILKKNLFNSPKEQFRTIYIKSRTSSGRVDSLIIYSNLKKYIVEKEKIRYIFKSRRVKTGLPSRLFSIYYIYDDNKLSHVVFAGTGYGHGVGLCQHGALFLSEQGFDYKSILSFYYPGTTLRKIFKGGRK